MKETFGLKGGSECRYALERLLRYGRAFYGRELMIESNRYGFVGLA